MLLYLPYRLLSLRAGEEIIKSFNQVVDTKGNINSEGSFWITNMRILWFLPGKKLNLRYVLPSNYLALVGTL